MAVWSANVCSKENDNEDCMSQSEFVWAQPGSQIDSASPGRNRRKRLSSGLSNLSQVSDLRS